MEFKLKGLPAVIVGILVIAAAVSWQLYLRNDAIHDPSLRETLQQHLMVEIAGDQIADAEKVRAAIDAGDHATAERLGQGMLQREVIIDEVALRTGGEDNIVKVDYTVKGPDGPRTGTRYYYMSYSTVTGWRWESDATAMSWHLSFF